MGERIRQNVLKFQDAEFCDFIMRCVNDQRLQSVESKVGRLDTENFKKIQGMFVADVYDELQKKKNEIIKSLHKTEIGKVRAFIATLIDSFLHRPNTPQNNSDMKEMDEPKDVKLSKSQKRKLRVQKGLKNNQQLNPPINLDDNKVKLSKAQRRRRRRRKSNKIMNV